MPEPQPADRDSGHGGGPSVTERIEGGLLGLAAGDALGASCEFLTPDQIRDFYGRHTEISGGGVLGWRPGQGTDDTDLTYAVARAYLDGYTLDGVAANLLAWYERNPRDVGRTTRAALMHIRDGGDPRASGEAALRWFGEEAAAGNGALMRALPTGLVRRDPATRRAEALEIAAITHVDQRCLSASVAYCDLAACLLDGFTATEAIEWALDQPDLHDQVRARLEGAAGQTLGALRPTGYVLDTLEIAAWAILQPATLEEILIEVVNLGDDADTTGAVAGGLLGVRDGANSIPERWLAKLEYLERLRACVAPLASLRGGRTGAA
jgi:ADP-ribosyl-[dinitrogen reductase] hydrolase